MADERTVFTILEDNSSGAGVKLPARSEGDAKGGNHAPVIHSVDSSGNYILDEKRIEGQAAASVSSQPSLGVKDKNGDLQFINSRDEGDAASGVDALPAFVAKDSSGNFAYLPLNASGQLIVSSDEEIGVKKYGYAKVTPSAINTLTTVCDVTLNTSKNYDNMEVRASCMFPCMWEIGKLDDGSFTASDSFLTGPGQFTFNMQYKQAEFTTGGTGAQKIRLRATQLQGAPSDMHGYVGCFEKA